MINDYPITMHFCTRCVEAAGNATYNYSGYGTKEEGGDPLRTVPLILILTMRNSVFTVPMHACEDDTVCNCTHTHTLCYEVTAVREERRVVRAHTHVHALSPEDAERSVRADPGSSEWFEDTNECVAALTEWASFEAQEIR
jgi:hypothetical protein